MNVSGSCSIVYSDASDLGVGGVVKDHQGVICHLPWTANETFRSSTWRELKAVSICLSSFSVFFCQGAQFYGSQITATFRPLFATAV